MLDETAENLEGDKALDYLLKEPTTKSKVDSGQKNLKRKKNAKNKILGYDYQKNPQNFHNQKSL